MAVRKARFEADRLNYEQMIRKITYFFVILEVTLLPLSKSNMPFTT